MPLSPMFLLLQLRYLRNLHHTLEVLIGWLVGQILEALCCFSGEGTCYAAPGSPLTVEDGVGGPCSIPGGLCRLSGEGYNFGVCKGSYICHPVSSQ